MRTTLDSTMVEAINASNTKELILPMVVLTHEDFAAPIRLARSVADITHNSEVYTAYPFDLTLPDEEPEKTAVIGWVASNVNSTILDELLAVVGPIEVAAFWILKSNPDHIQIGPFSLQLRNFEWDKQEIRGSLDVEPILHSQFGVLMMDGKNAPGLF